MAHRGWTHNRDERGLVLPTRLMVFSISAVALAGLAFVVTQPAEGPDTAARAAVSQPKTSPTVVTPAVPVAPPPTAKARPAVRKGAVYVSVFNNSNVKGLAGATAARAQRSGWNVVGTDNWYGTIDTSTVYYGPRLKAAGQLLAKELGIARVKASIAPMRPDRLTVVLTAGYH